MAEWLGCGRCKHLRLGKGEKGYWCAAYPQGIPMAIASGDADHSFVRPRQVGQIVFEAYEGETRNEDEVVENEEDTEFRIFPNFTPARTFMLRAKNCKKGIACGDSCISKLKTCRKTLVPPQQKKKVPAAKKAVNKKGKSQELTVLTAQPFPAPIYDSYTDKAKIHEDFHALYDLASGESSPNSIVLRKKDLQEARAITMGSDKFWQESKVAKIQAENSDISKDEAAALAHWVSHGYFEMNRRIYAPDSLKESEKQALLTVDILAAKALQKLPPVTNSSVAIEAALKGEKYTPNQPFDRYVSLTGTAKATYIKQFEDAKTNGKPHLEQTFFCTTHLEADDMGYFSNKATIKFVVNAKMDGTGAGRYVDHFKNSASEGEVLFPPMTKFKVTKIDRTTDYTPSQIEAVKQYSEIETAKKQEAVFKSHGMDETWAKFYVMNTGKQAPTDAQIKKIEASYQKIGSLPKNKFIGTIIELEEL